jgi:HPt (histidine-containing phosphotransfer) domain-containing protein
MSHPLDLEHVAELSALGQKRGRPSYLGDLVATFAAQFEGTMRQLRTLDVSAERDAFLKVLHSGKSASAAIGAKSLHGLCAKWEQELKHGRAAAPKKWIELLGAEFTRTLSAYAKLK